MQINEGACWRHVARNEHIIVFGRRVGQNFCGHGAKASARAVAHDGIADLAARGKSITNSRGRFVRRADLEDKSGRNPSFAA